MRAHVTIYPGGGLFPNTPVGAVQEIARRSATVFTSVADVRAMVPDAIPTTVPVPSSFYEYRSRSLTNRPRLTFVGDDRPRKGLETMLQAMELAKGDYAIDVVGPHERHADRLAQFRARVHGWLQPDDLRRVLLDCDVIVAPASADRPEDGYGDTGVVDGFPTTAVRVAMLTGCCLVGSENPTSGHDVAAGRSALSRVPERDPSRLVQVLQEVSADGHLRDRIARAGAERLRAQCGVEHVVALKLRQMGLEGAG